MAGSVNRRSESWRGASLAHHLRALGVALDPAAFDALLAAVVARSDEKQRIPCEDLPLLLRELVAADEAGKGRADEAGKEGADEAAKEKQPTEAAQKTA